MNERIWKIYGEALIGVSEGGGDVLDPIKFAELIVREAASLVASAQVTQDGHTWRSADRVVLEHFGVDK